MLSVFRNCKHFSPKDGINILRFLGHFPSYCVTVRFINRVIILDWLGLTVFRLLILLRWRQLNHMAGKPFKVWQTDRRENKRLWLCWCMILLSNILVLCFVICMRGFEIFAVGPAWQLVSSRSVLKLYIKKAKALICSCVIGILHPLVH